jgi:AcrR family transcriptional regulator
MARSRPPARRKATDHRARVGRERRARTRGRILGAALGVFAAKGREAPVIDDFIKAAGVARGTFYNHFRTTGELREAASKWLEDQLMLAIEGEIGALEDPVKRLATGVRLWLRWAQSDRTGCGFVVNSRFRGPLVEEILTADLRGGRRAGGFRFRSVEAARDLVVGTILEAMHRMLTARVSKSYPEDVARLILRGLGLDERAIDGLLALPAPELPRSVDAPR